MVKSYMVHYMNKYPGCRVAAGEDYLDVFGKDGGHKVALRKNGAGQWVCQSEMLGCDDRHDLAPIPKESRAYKLYADGKIGKAEEFAERKPAGEKLAEANSGKVPSNYDLEAKK